MFQKELQKWHIASDSLSLYRLVVEKDLVLWLYKHNHSLKGSIHEYIYCSYLLMGKVVG